VNQTPVVMMTVRHPVGMVLGTERPLKWLVEIDPDAHLQLDDVVSVRTLLSGSQHVQISGLVDLVRAQHEGSRFESDVLSSP
jgi:uncharacterized protein